MEMKLMEPILDFKDILNAKNKFLRFIGQNSGEVDSFWIIKNQNWQVKAIYDGDLYEDKSETLLMRTLNKYGFSSLTGVSFLQCIHGGNFSPFNVVNIPATIAGIEEFRVHSIFDWCLLFSGDPDWAILVVHSMDFLLIMGKDGIFSELYNIFSDDVLSGLSEMSKSEHLCKDIRDFYTNLLYQVDVVYPEAKVGEVISIKLPNSNMEY